MPYREAILVWCTNCGTVRVYNVFKDCVCGSEDEHKELVVSTKDDGVTPVLKIETK